MKILLTEPHVSYGYSQREESRISSGFPCFQKAVRDSVASMAYVVLQLLKVVFRKFGHDRDELLILNPEFAFLKFCTNAFHATAATL